MPPDNQTYRETATSHIRELSTLTARLPSILHSASTSVSQLTNAPISLSSPDSPQARREALSASSHEYFTAVLDVAKALHKQVTDLEEAGVIPADEVRYVARTEGDPGAPGQQVQTKDSEASVTNGGSGEFDVGVLNARAGVSERGEDEVLERLRSLLEDLGKRMDGNGEEGGKKIDET